MNFIELFVANQLKAAFMSVVWALVNTFKCNLNGFDSVGGTYDEQTGFGFDKMNFMRARARTIVGALSKGSEKTYNMVPGSGPSLDGSGIIIRKEITSGDMARYTMQEHMAGTPTYGDLPVKRGNFLRWKNAEVRINKITSPSIPIQGEEDQKRVRDSITNIPGAAREEVIDYHAEEYERQFLISLLYGASPSVLLPTDEGGLGHSLGVGAGGGAGVPLMCRNFYTPDTGILTYNSTVATWNSMVNDAVDGVDADAADMITLNAIEMLVAAIDDIKIWSPTINGKKYKVAWLCDPAIWYRLNNLLRPYYKEARERSKDNPLFNYTDVIEFMDCIFISVPNLKKFRPAYNAATGYPDIGPGLRNDHRNYTTSSRKAWMIGVGARLAFEGYEGSVKVMQDKGRFERGLEIASEGRYGFTRGEFYAKDGETGADACVNHSSICCVFDEPGVGVNYNN